VAVFFFLFPPFLFAHIGLGNANPSAWNHPAFELEIGVGGAVETEFGVFQNETAIAPLDIPC
jgi:hypothetical protein